MSNKKIQKNRIKSRFDNTSIFYKRGARAIARQIIRETKGAFAPDKFQTQGFIDGFYNTYPETKLYMDMCDEKVITPPHYIENPFGRRRHFTVKGADQGAIAAQQRECVNFPIQSTVADNFNQAMINLYNWRYQHHDEVYYKILMGIYDAVLLEVPGEYAKIVVEEVLPTCMTKRAVVLPWRFALSQPTTQPFSLDIDITVSVRWGVDPSRDELKAANVCEELIERFA